jgi:hypothetical protein
MQKRMLASPARRAGPMSGLCCHAGIAGRSAGLGGRRDRENKVRIRPEARPCGLRAGEA